MNFLSARHLESGKFRRRTVGDGPLEAFGICERQDDVCATAYLYCRDRQSVRRLDVGAALANIERRPWEVPAAMEAALGMLS